MKFLNFDIRSSIELHGIGLNWELHNFAHFLGLRLMSDTSVVLTWVMPANLVISGGGTPWGDFNNHYSGCQLLFRGVRRISITGADPEMPTSESRTLAEIISWPTLPKKDLNVSGPSQSESTLLLEFQSGLSIEVDASEAELVPIERGDRRLTTD
jgi:hypothetical protein